MVFTRFRRSATALLMASFLLGGSAPGFAASADEVNKSKARTAQDDKDRLVQEKRRFDADVLRTIGLMKGSENPKTVAKGHRLELWKQIADAPSQAVRHALVQQLGVRVTTSRAIDGRDGIVKTFFTRGKVQSTKFYPTEVALRWPSVLPSESSSLVLSECWLEEEEPCATEQETEDYEIGLAAADAENAQWDADIDEALDYCNNNYCGLDPSLVPLAEGDLSRIRCVDYAVDAVWALGSAVAGFFGLAADLYAAQQATKLVARYRMIAGWAALLSGSFVLGYAGAAFIDCYFFYADGAPGHEPRLGSRPAMMY